MTGTPSHNGVSGLPNELPVLDRATEAALKASIGKHGVLLPVVEDQHGRILDGHHRARIADALEPIAFCPRIVMEVRDDDHAREIARELNLTRRHLTPEQRQTLAAQLRAEGHSLRAIGGALGASKTQIAKDLSTSGHLPDHVRGRDGKNYPTRRPRRRTKKAPVERTLYMRFVAAFDATEDVLADPDALAAAIPAKDREAWASKLRDVAAKATIAAKHLAAERTL